jgi:hypothetical protein
MTFFDRRFRLFFGKGGQISPNCDVISSIIDWLLMRGFSIKTDDEWHDAGGVRRLTIDIEFDNDDSLGGDDDDDKQGE